MLAKTLPNCDLVIADYVMPALTGAQLATRLARAPLGQDAVDDRACTQVTPTMRWTTG